MHRFARDRIKKGGDVRRNLKEVLFKAVVEKLGSLVHINNLSLFLIFFFSACTIIVRAQNK